MLYGKKGFCEWRMEILDFNAWGSSLCGEKGNAGGSRVETFFRAFLRNQLEIGTNQLRLRNFALKALDFDALKKIFVKISCP